MKPVQGINVQEERESVSKWVKKMQMSGKKLKPTDLHSSWANNIKSCCHTSDKLEDFGKAVISNTPWAIDEEDQVSLRTFTHCGGGKKDVYGLFYENYYVSHL